MLKLKPITASFVLVFGLNSCGTADLPEPTAVPSFSPIWTLSQGMAQPESVVYDATRSVLYVSNVQGQPLLKDGKGYISTVSLEGKLLNEKWVAKDLNAPKGMAIVGNILYTSDIDALVAIDINKAEVIKRYEAENAKFLNDVTADKAGNVYVSDTFTDTIHCLCKGQFGVWLQDAGLMGPNGLLAEENRLVVGSWGVMTDGFATETPGHLQAVDYANKKITPIGDNKPVGNLDGVESDGENGYYVSDWMAGKLFHFNAAGQAQELMQLKQGSADIAFLINKNLLLVPMMNDNQVKAFKKD
jgi:sugar lactone lactonase YvrE